MSRVIKAPVIKEKPRSIETPAPKPSEKELDANEAQESGFSEEARDNMLQEIAEKEQRADDLLKDAQVQSQIIQQNAQTDYDKRMSEAQNEIDAKREEARQEGHDEGFKQGEEEGKKKAEEDMTDAIRKANAQAEKTLRDAKIASEDYVQQAEQQIVEIAMTAVEKILPQHFIDVPQVLLPVVREALLKVKDQTEIVVHVPPDAYDMVLMARDEFRGLLTGGNANLSIQSDEALKPGDCVIDTPNGTVDARLATQIESVKNAVREVMS